MRLYQEPGLMRLAEVEAGLELLGVVILKAGRWWRLEILKLW